MKFVICWTKKLDGAVSVITIGTPDQVRVSTNYKIDDADPAVDQEIESLLFEGVKPLLPEGSNIGSVHNNLHPEFSESGTEYGRRHQEQRYHGGYLRDVLYGSLYPASFP